MFLNVKCENLLRHKNITLFFGFLVGIFCTIGYDIFFFDANYILFKTRIPMFVLYFLYYLIMVYIKIRVSLLNHELLCITKTENLSFCDFLYFYELQPCQSKYVNHNQKFANIFPFDNKLVDLLTVTKEKLLRLIQFIFGLFISVFSIVNCRSLKFDIDDTVSGIRQTAFRQIDFKIMFLQKRLNNLKNEKADLQNPECKQHDIIIELFMTLNDKRILQALQKINFF